jgi:hypothetical protein
MIADIFFYGLPIFIATIVYEYIIVRYAIFLSGLDIDIQDDQRIFKLYNKRWAPKIISEACLIISVIYIALFCQPVSEHLEAIYILILLFVIFNFTVFVNARKAVNSSR